MNLKYENEIDKEIRKPKTVLSSDGEHIGTIWGIAKEGEDAFEREHGIIYIYQGETMIATLWNTSSKS